jgi:hypothetical protein
LAAVQSANAAATLMQSETPSPEPADAAVAFARRLLARERAGDASDAGLARALEQSCSLITVGLSRWFGLYGTRALVTRALATAQKRHPALARVGVSDDHCLEGVSASAQLHGSAVVAEGIVVTIAGLVSLLGRLIGDDLAVALLEQSTITETTSRASTRAPQEQDHPPTKVKRDE